MLNKFKGFLALALVLTLVPVGAGVYAEEVETETPVVETVSTTDEFLQAIADEKSVITLGADINVTEKVNITYDVTIDGNGHAIIGNNVEGWQGFYILQVYRATATIKNVTLTGGDAGLLVNGSNVTLEGTVDVSGNEFGGIEVSKGQDVTETPLLTINGQVTNTTDAEGLPTIWLDGLNEGVVATQEFEIKTVNNQVHYHIPTTPVNTTVEVDSEQAFLDAVAAGANHITLTADISISSKINILHDVVIDGAGHTISGTPNAGWQGLFGIQFYNVDSATIKNLNFTNLDAAILVNGSNLTLEGAINLSGNEFGGIELSKGKDVTNNVVLDVTNAVLTNDTEDYGLPTVWVDNTLDAEVIGGTFVVRKDIKASQVQYYLNAETNKEAKANEMFYEMFAALNSDKIKVNVNETDGSLQVVLIDATVDVDAVVDVLTSIIVDNDEVVGFQIAGAGAGFSEKPSEEDIRATIENLVTLYLSSTRTAVAAEGRAIPFGLIVNVDGTDVETDVVNVSFTSRNGTVDPVEPTKPTEDKETPKTDGAKTPNTGLSDMMTMYASLIVLGAIVLVTLKTKKRYN